MHVAQVLLGGLGGSCHSSQGRFVLLAGGKLQDLLLLPAQKKTPGVLVQLSNVTNAAVCTEEWEGGGGGGGLGEGGMFLDLSIMKAACALKKTWVCCSSC